MLSPLLSVRHGSSAIDFYKRALDAVELFRIEDEKGEIVAKMSVDGAEFWIADESPKHFNFSPESLGGSSFRMVLAVENPDAVFEKAVKQGAKVVWPVANQSYRWRVGRIVDPFGHHWEIGKPLVECADESKRH
ncbi:MAG TPA: VOC family protein [Verrucomicrobiae bacterium]